MTDIIDQLIETNFELYQDTLFELLEQPSISITGEGMNTIPKLVCETLSQFGFENVLNIQTDHHPVIYGEQFHTENNSYPTVLFYGHYDVQPPGDENMWNSPPFDPTVRNERIFARGVGDNKGQFSAHIFAVHALIEAECFPDVNIKILLDGGEESGSAGFQQYLQSNPQKLDGIDLIYVADGPMFDSGLEENDQRPLVAYGNRGVLSFQLDYQTANSDLHSGNYGGPVPNPAAELVQLLSSMREDGNIVIDGFHDGIKITEEDRTIVENIIVDENAIKNELGLSHLASELPYYERLLLHPTLTINGLSSGYQEEGAKTVLPSTATAKFDCRLVPNQDPDAVFESIREHVIDQNSQVEVTYQGAFPSMKTPVDTPLSEPVLNALSEVWGTDPVEFPVLGGSLPVAYFRHVQSLSDVPILVVPYGNPNQGNHSPNEFMRLEDFKNGIRTTARFLQRIERHE